MGGIITPLTRQCFSEASPLYSYLPHDALLSPCTFLSSKKKKMFLYFLSFSDPVQKYIHAFSNTNTLGFLSLNPTLLPPCSCLLTSSAKQAGFLPPKRHDFLSSYSPSPSSWQLPRFRVGLSYCFPINSNKTVLQLSFNSFSTFYFILMRLIQCSYKESLTFPQQYVEVRKEEH